MIYHKVEKLFVLFDRKFSLFDDVCRKYEQTHLFQIIIHTLSGMDDASYFMGSTMYIWRNDQNNIPTYHKKFDKREKKINHQKLEDIFIVKEIYLWYFG